MMAYTGNCPVERRTLIALVAAAVWLVGLVVGGSALVAGDLVVAAVSVLLALVVPWLGLAWNLHARLRADDVPFPGGGVPQTAG
jgi:Flp pilus assembly protein TadB